ncbi:hypothetical protein RQN30_08840 [Arcanobacterium hippocoleae]
MPHLVFDWRTIREIRIFNAADGKAGDLIFRRKFRRSHKPATSANAKASGSRNRSETSCRQLRTEIAFCRQLRKIVCFFTAACASLREQQLDEIKQSDLMLTKSKHKTYAVNPKNQL